MVETDGHALKLVATVGHALKLVVIAGPQLLYWSEIKKPNVNRLNGARSSMSMP